MVAGGLFVCVGEGGLLKAENLIDHVSHWHVGSCPGVNRYELAHLIACSLLSNER